MISLKEYHIDPVTNMELYYESSDSEEFSDTYKETKIEEDLYITNILRKKNELVIQKFLRNILIVRFNRRERSTKPSFIVDGQMVLMLGNRKMI